MGETLILNRSLDPLYEDYIELNDLNMPLELRRNQVDGLGPTAKKGEGVDKHMIKEVRTRNDDNLVSKIFGYPNDYDEDEKIHIDYAYILKFSCMIGFEFVHTIFFPNLPIKVMSKKFYNSIVKDKIEFKGRNELGNFANVHVFIGNFYVITDFTVVEDMNPYLEEGMGDVIVGEPFCDVLCVETRRFNGIITIRDDDDSVTYQMVLSHPSESGREDDVYTTYSLYDTAYLADWPAFRYFLQDLKGKKLKNAGIAPVAIIDGQLPFEYTITSRSTDVMVMALPIQKINHSAFRSMFEREKLSGNNFNDLFRQLKLVLRVEKKLFVIEQPLPAAPAADSKVLAQWNAVCDAYNEVACLILGSMTPELHRQFENSSPYDMIKELKSMFEKQVGGYVKQLERLGYVLLQDISVGLILNGLTSDFAGFVRNYNMHNIGKTIVIMEYFVKISKKARILELKRRNMKKLILTSYTPQFSEDMKSRRGQAKLLIP
ncbi:hypothetical protein Tco_1027317 [Tanacetum coccineum]